MAYGKGDASAWTEWYFLDTGFVTLSLVTQVQSRSRMKLLNFNVSSYFFQTGTLDEAKEVLCSRCLEYKSQYHGIITSRRLNVFLLSLLCMIPDASILRHNGWSEISSGKRKYRKRTN